MFQDVIYFVVLLAAGIPALMARPQQYSYNFQPSHHWKLTDLNYLNALRSLQGSFQTQPSTPAVAPVATPPATTTTTIRRPENIQAIIGQPPVRQATGTGTAVANGQNAFASGQGVGTAGGQFITVGPQGANVQRPVAQSSFRNSPPQQPLTPPAIPSVRQQQPVNGIANAAGVGGGSASGNRVTGVGVSSASAQNGGVGFASGQGSGVSRPTGSSAGGNSVSLTQGAVNRPVNTGTVPQSSVVAPQATRPSSNTPPSAFRPSQPVGSSNAVGGGSGSVANGQVTGTGTAVANAQNGGVAISSGQGVGASSPSGNSATGSGQSLAFGGPTTAPGNGAGLTPQGSSGPFRPSQPIFFDNSDAIGTGSGSAGNGQASGFGTAVSSAQNGGVGFASGQGSGSSSPSGNFASGTGNSFAAGSPVIVGSPAPSGGAVPQNSVGSAPQNVQDINNSANQIVFNTNFALQELIKSIFAHGITPIFGNLIFGNGQNLTIGGLVHLQPANRPTAGGNTATNQGDHLPVVSGLPPNSVETSTVPSRPTQSAVPGDANAAGVGAGTAGNGQASGIGTAVSSAQNGGVGVASGQGSGTSDASGNSASGSGNSIATGSQARPTETSTGNPLQTGSSSALGTGSGTANKEQVTGTGIAISNAQNGGIGIASGQGIGSSSPSGNSASGIGNSQSFGSIPANGFLRLASTATPLTVSVDEPVTVPVTTTSLPLVNSFVDNPRGFGGSANAAGTSDGSGQVGATSGPVANIPSGSITIPPSLSSALAAFFGNLLASNGQSVNPPAGFSPRIAEELAA